MDYIVNVISSLTIRWMELGWASLRWTQRQIYNKVLAWHSLIRTSSFPSLSIYLCCIFQLTKMNAPLELRIRAIDHLNHSKAYLIWMTKKYKSHQPTATQVRMQIILLANPQGIQICELIKSGYHRSIFIVILLL